MTPEQATLLFLVFVFILAELHRMRRARRGLIVGVRDPGLPLAVAPVLEVRVRFKDGTEIDATLNLCTACMGRLNVGDEVRVSGTGEGWIVDLPWRRKSRSCCSGIGNV